MLRTFFFATMFLPWTLGILVVCLALSSRGPDFVYRCGRVWARVGLKLSGVTVACRGAAPGEAGGAAIYMPNHSSNFDILALLVCCVRPFRWLAKKELFRIPLFGAALRAAGTIAIDRSDREKAIISMGEATRRIQGGDSIMIFPEGTRSPDGRLLPFKKGGFMSALAAQVPIVPVAISGSGAIMPKHSLWIRPGKIIVEFLPPIATEDMKPADRDRLMAQVRQSLCKALGQKDH